MKEEIIIEALKGIQKIATTFSDNSRKKKEDEKDEKEAELKKREQELALQAKNSDNLTNIAESSINTSKDISQNVIDSSTGIAKDTIAVLGKTLKLEKDKKEIEFKENQTKIEIEKTRTDKLENKHNKLLKEQDEERIKTIKFIADIHQNYQNHIYNYQAEISIKSRGIKKLKRKIESKKDKISKEEKSLVNVQNEIVYENKIFDTLHHEFEQKIKSIKELKFEYKKTMNGDKYQETLGRKQRELDEVLDKIEDTEISLLNKELERINLEEKLQPERDNIAMLEESLVELEDKKEHFENTGLNKPLSSDKSIEKKNEEYIEDVDVINSQLHSP